MAIFDFSTWRTLPCWIFKIRKFEGWKGPKGLKYVTMPSFVTICQITAEICRFFDFAHLAPEMVAK